MFGAGKALGPAVAGSWYPADRAALKRQLDGLFRDAETVVENEHVLSGSPAALIAPHAGFVYSGLVAAKGFRRLCGTAISRVVLLGPSHYAAFDGAVLPEAALYRTPLGDVPIDTDLCRRLAGLDGYRADNGPFEREHSLEAELPFLQHRLGSGFRLLPILIGMLGPLDAETIAVGLRPLLDARTLVVVSSDFTHFGPRFDYVPFEEEVPVRIEDLDRGAIRRILAADGPGFVDYVRRTGATICGRNPIRVLLDLLPHDSETQLVAYDTSGRMTGEWDHSVSYASLVFHTAAPWPG